jgi:SAM-dependent methyltransferase
LDLGCGDGTTALPEAKLGADVLGVDIASNLVAAGNKRAKEQGLTNCKFQEGDASNLHELQDHTFDLVVSIFGAMFAPKPFDDIGGTNPENQCLLLAAAPGRVRKSYDVGDRERRDRAICGCRGSKEEDIVRQRHLHLQLSRPAIRVR